MYDTMTIPEMRRIGQKAGDVQWALPARTVSIYVTRLLLPTRVTPNQVTWMWGAVNTVTAGLLATGNLWCLLLVPLAIQVYIVLDCVDGEIARLRRVQSVGGKKLEQFVHEIFDNQCIIAVTVGAYLQTGWLSCWAVGLALFFGRNMKEKVEYMVRTSIGVHADAPAAGEDAEAPPPARPSSPLSRLKELLDYVPYKGLHLIVLLGVLHQMVVALALWTAVMNLRWIRKTIYWQSHMDQANRVMFLVLPSALFERTQHRAGQAGQSMSGFIASSLETTLGQEPSEVTRR